MSEPFDVEAAEERAKAILTNEKSVVRPELLHPEAGAVLRLAQMLREAEERLRNEHEAATFWQSKAEKAEPALREVACSVCDRECLIHGNFRALYREAVEALEAIANYKPTPEVCYDQFAYERMCESFSDAARAVLAKARREFIENETEDHGPCVSLTAHERAVQSEREACERIVQRMIGSSDWSRTGYDTCIEILRRLRERAK